MPPPQLAIIDPSPYLTPSAHSDADRATTANQLHEACRDTGFFYLRIDRYFSEDELKDVLAVGRKFFARPEEEKEQVGLERSDGVRGYQRLHQNITLGKADHHEGFDLYAPDPYPPQTSASGAPPQCRYRPLQGPTLYPAHPARFQSVVESWVGKMKVLGMAVMRGMADGLGLTEEEWSGGADGRGKDGKGEKGLRGMVDDSFWVMRLIGYPPLPDGADGISCGEHKDYGCLTFLHADPINGSLQVLSRPRPPSSSTDDDALEPNPQNGQCQSQQGGRWIPADPIPGCILVNIGSMWEIWSGGLYPATVHRVIHRSPEYRISVPFFFEPNFQAVVKVLPAALRKRKAEAEEEEGRGRIGAACTLEEGSEEGVRYGDFLLEKVGGNFKY